MTRYALVVALILSGCAAGSIDLRSDKETTKSGSDAVGYVVGTLAIVAVVGAGYLIYQAIPARAPAKAPPPPVPEVWGTVVWADSGKRLPAVAVILAGRKGEIARTTSDKEGNFHFPPPVPTGELRVTIDDDRAEGFNAASLGQTTIIEAQPKEAPAAAP